MVPIPPKTRLFAARATRSVANQSGYHTGRIHSPIQHRSKSSNYGADPNRNAVLSIGHHSQHCGTPPFKSIPLQSRRETPLSVYRKSGTPQNSTLQLLRSDLLEKQKPSESAKNSTTINENHTASPRYVDPVSTHSTIGGTALLPQTTFLPISVKNIILKKQK